MQVTIGRIAIVLLMLKLLTVAGGLCIFYSLLQFLGACGCSALWESVCMVCVVAAGAECAECSWHGSSQRRDSCNAYALHTASSAADPETCPSQPDSRWTSAGDRNNVITVPSYDNNTATADAGQTRDISSLKPRRPCTSADSCYISSGYGSDSSNICCCELTYYDKQPPDAARHHPEHTQCYDSRRCKGCLHVRLNEN